LASDLRYNGIMTKRNTKVGLVLTWLVALAPLVLVVAFGPKPTSQPLQTMLDNFARMAGFIGFTLFAWNLILSARIPWLEKQFGGLDKLYKVHHTVGGIAFITMLVHPTLLTIKYATISFASAYSFLLPTLDDVALQAGKVALGGMFVVLFITFYIWVSHERFMWIHRLTGVLFAFAVYHAFFVAGSRVLQISALAFYLGLLSLTALGLFGYRYVFKSLKPRRRYKVAKVDSLGDAWEVSLAPTARGIDHTAGQFAFLTFISPNLPQQTHPFTIASAPSEEGLHFVIKNLGDFTAKLGELKVGDHVFAEGPYGTFNYANMSRKRQVWVAGGIGITPFLSMAHSMKQGDGVEAHLFYSVADETQAYGAQELSQLAGILQDTLSFALHDSSKQGFISVEQISKLVPNLAECEVLLCGPKGMMKALEAQFIAAGVSKKHIQYEEFSLL
jgi:predicted ferric reductase